MIVQFAFNIGDTVVVKPTGRTGTVWHLSHNNDRQNLVTVEDETGAILGVFREEQLVRNNG